MKITIRQGSILEQQADAIVNAANSKGVMGGGVAGAIRRAGGVVIEREAITQAPIPIGSAVITTGGSLPFRIIHAPTMEHPAEETNVSAVKLATLAALELADKCDFKRIAIPGMGTGVGGVSPIDAAAAMIAVIKAFPAKSLQEVILVDISGEMVDAWRKAL